MKNFHFLSILLLIGTGFPVDVLAHKQSKTSIMNMSLEELNKVEVTSVSRKAESQFRAAAAISVLTSEDIKRAGATSIAEALRLVPGINVAQMDSNKWAITARGFNRQFSNKLLVQIDGRSVYTPLFSGVYWDAQDLILEDVERIEVIRGPGATMWGANAVNGIINITTKKSHETEGTYVAKTFGNYEKSIFEVRRGGHLSDDTHYRVYAKSVQKGSTKQLGSSLDNGDEWKQRRVGFRIDKLKSFSEEYTLQGDVYVGHEEQTYLLPGAVSAGTTSEVDGDEDIAGGNVLAKWTKTQSNGVVDSLKFYIDYIQRDMSNILDQRRFTFDLDYQQNRLLDDRNDITWGIGYRFFREHLDENTFENGQQYLNYEPEISNNNLFNLFVQNKTAVVPDKLYLTLGSKFSHNYFTGFETLPNVRASYHLCSSQTLWAAVSRAIRIPTKGERGLNSIALSTGTGFVRQAANINRSYDSEKLIAYEMGYRAQLHNRMSLDATLFYNEYDELRTFESGQSGWNLPNTARELVASNSGFGETYGLEVNTNISVAPEHKISLAYSYLEMDLHAKSGSDDFLLAAKEGQSPSHQVNISSRYNVLPNVQFDNTLYYVSRLPEHNVDGYIRFDSRISYKPSDSLELSVVGQNIFDSAHQETGASLYSRATEIGRSIYGRISYEF